MGLEESVLEELFHQYSPIIYCYIYFVTKCKEEAEDLTQEVFIKAYRGICHYRGESSYKTWLYTIARNVIIDQYRKKRKADCLIDLPLPDLYQLGPEVWLDRKEDTQMLHRAIIELAFLYREIVILRKIKGYSIAETAKIFGWAEGKVKVTLHRALHRLRERLNPQSHAGCHGDGSCTAWLCGVQRYNFNEIGLLEEWRRFCKPKTDHLNKNTGENVAKELEIFIADGGSFDKLERKARQRVRVIK